MKVQYFAPDLSELLHIGDIEEMHVDTDEFGVQVLRIEYYGKPKEEYKTVKASGAKRTTRARDIEVSRGPAKPMRFNSEKPMSVGSTLLQKGAEWMKRNKKPPFMEDAGF
jgi:hypothetical protein